jgi:hypothetical protein
MLTIKLFGIYIVMKICVPIPFFSLLVSYDMGIWNKKTTLIKINNNEKGFIQIKETIQASHQQWNIKKITIFFRSGKSWFSLVNDLGSPDQISCKKIYNFAFTGSGLINRHVNLIKSHELYSVVCSIELFIIWLCRLFNRAEI